MQPGAQAPVGPKVEGSLEEGDGGTAMGSQTDRMRKLSPNATNLDSTDCAQLQQGANLFGLFIYFRGVPAPSFPFRAHFSALGRKMR